MTVTCPKCRATLSISDDRLPKGKAFNAGCPRCGTAIAIDTTQGVGASDTCRRARIPR